MTTGEFKKMFLKDLIFVLFLVVVFLIFLQPTIVRQTSMYPTFNDGDYLMVYRQAYTFGDVHRGDIVVFKSNMTDDDGDDKLLIKRVMGLPGDVLRIEDRVLYINGEVYDEPYIQENSEYMEEITVPKGCYFCMGDNRCNSLDSREIGAIPEDKFVGKVLIRLYPFDKIGTKF